MHPTNVEPNPIPVASGIRSSLKELGYDEHWLQDWFVADPARLGLGEVEIVDQEQHQASGGLLDLLAIDKASETYYSVEIQLGEIDGSHSFRVFDYWARNRSRLPGKTHVAVLLAESAGGRFRPALEALAESVPIVVVELGVWRGNHEAVLIPDVVVANETLDLADTKVGEGSEERTEEDWEREATGEAWSFKEAFVAWAAKALGPPRVDYRPKSYIGVRYGRRVWAPLWLRTDGAYVYLPDPDGSRDEPSLAFEHFDQVLGKEGISLSWATKYNAGANPIGLRLTKPDLERPQVQALLRASWEALEVGAPTWSEKRPAPKQSGTELASPENAVTPTDV